MEDSTEQTILKWLRNMTDGVIGHEMEAVATKGLRMVKLQKGLLLCDFVVHTGVTDESGKWGVGGIASLIDVVGSLAAFSFTAYVNVTVGIDVSYYSEAKLQEEVDVEGKVVGKKGRMTSVKVEVKKKQNREMVALAKLWMAPASSTTSHQATSKL